MYKKMGHVIFSLLMLSVYYHAIEIERAGTIPIHQESVILQRITDFCVIENNQFLFPDHKAGDIKIYDNKGNLVKVWGRKGPGPNEFFSPIYCDYRAPYLVLMDYGKSKLFVFKKEKGLNFRKFSESLIVSLGYDIKFMDPGKILISGYKADPAGKSYDLYFFNPQSTKSTLILPSQEKYGYSSYREYKKIYSTKIAPIGIGGYCDYSGQNIYFAWEGNLKIIKINSDTKEIHCFGRKTENYITPRATPVLLKLYKERGRQLKFEMQKYSFVTGIFTDDGFVALTYATFRKDIEGWQTIVQLYTPTGKFLIEKILPGAVNITPWADPSFCYVKKENLLYYLSRTMDEEFNDIYKILKFKITL